MYAADSVSTFLMNFGIQSLLNKFQIQNRIRREQIVPKGSSGVSKPWYQSPEPRVVRHVNEYFIGSLEGHTHACTAQQRSLLHEPTTK